MHFLLTNDDGIHAPGLAALEDAVRAIPGATYSVVAPATEQSQCGHRVTTREVLTATQLDTARFCVDGTPADCVRIALFALGLRPDYVLSGVNAGGNMGQDLYISGTVAGAREAVFHGIPALAISHYLIKEFPLDWQVVTKWTSTVLAELLPQPLADAEYWNVNFPHLPAEKIAGTPDRVFTHSCRAPLNVSYASTALADGISRHRYTATYASRPVEPGSDVAICFGGQISVSRLRI